VHILQGPPWGLSLLGEGGKAKETVMGREASRKKNIGTRRDMRKKTKKTTAERGLQRNRGNLNDKKGYQSGGGNAQLPQNEKSKLWGKGRSLGQKLGDLQDKGKTVKLVPQYSLGGEEGT